MSYMYNTYVACPAVQDMLNDQFLNNPQLTPWPIGALRVVTNDRNTNNTLQRVISSKGKLRTVELTYQPRFTDASSDSAVLNCNGGTEYGNTSATYQIDPTVGKSRSWTVTPAEMQESCIDDAAWMAKQVQMHMNAGENDIDKELVTFMQTNRGQFYDSTDTERTTNTRTTTNAYNTDLIGDVAYEFERIQWMTGQPVLIGDGELNKYMRATQAGCCALQGVDLGEFARQNPFIFVRDPYLPAALGGDERFLVYGWGAIQMLSFLQFENPVLRMNNELVKQGVLVNPESGIAWDYSFNYNCGVFNFQIKLAYVFVVIPQDVYRTDDPLEGTNGMLVFDIENPA